MTAGVPDPAGELREALAVLLAHERAGKLSAWGLADALLSGPLAPLLAKLRAVEECYQDGHSQGYVLDSVLRRALDG